MVVDDGAGLQCGFLLKTNALGVVMVHDGDDRFVHECKSMFVGENANKQIQVHSEIQLWIQTTDCSDPVCPEQ